MDYFPLDDITNEEREGIMELRRRVENEMTPARLKDSSVFIRFLRARDGNVDKATEMLRRHIEWRKQNDIDNIFSYKEPEVSKYISTTLIGYDKEGHPIRHVDMGRVDIKGILKSIKKEEYIKCFVKMMESDEEKLRQQSEKYGRTIATWNIIYDFDHLTFASATNKSVLMFLIQLITIYESNYPERLKHVFIINASRYFAMVFNIVKPIFTGRSLQKAVFFGKDGWKEALLKIIDADVLPVFLGGTRTDENGDPLCSSFIRHGCPVPESCYFRSAERRLNNKQDIRKLVVSRMSKMDVKLDVKKPGDFIEWEFETESGDIAFGLFLAVSGQSENAVLKEIIQIQRVPAHIACETGTYMCEEPGKYVLQFDNSFSWLRRKEVYYRVKVVETKR